MSKKAIIILVVLVVIIGGGVAYYSMRAQSRGGFGGPNGDLSGNASSTGRGMMRNLPAGSEAIFGTIGSVSGDTFTITDRSGAVKNVTVTSDTQFTGGTKADLKAGARVGGIGSTTPSGITATQIRLGMMGSGRRPGGGTNQPAQ